jgi:hypothetical protein
MDKDGMKSGENSTLDVKILFISLTANNGFHINFAPTGLFAAWPILLAATQDYASTIYL